MVIMTPADATECRGLLTTAFLHDGPSAVRYPRGAAADLSADLSFDEHNNSENSLTALPFAQGVQARTGKKIALLVFGSLLSTALEVAEELDASVYNMRFVKPLDNRLVDDALSQHDLLVTIEDNAIAGGAGSAVCEYLNALPQSSGQSSGRVLQIGFPDEFINHGQPDEMLTDWKLDKQGILETIQSRIKELLI
jgi:1-deoxy-D-xylulose-5-phosphate synthase